MSSTDDVVRELIVSSLRLNVDPAGIASDMDLFGMGLGLDSVDSVQLLVSIEAHFGVTFSDAELAERPLTSVDTIVQLLRRKGIR